MAKYYTKRPSYPEIKKLLDKYINRNQDKDRGIDWKHYLYYEPHDELDRPILVPNTVYWQVIGLRRIAPLTTLVSSAILFLMALFFQ